MTKEKLYEVFGEINENHIMAAETHCRGNKRAWCKWGVAAACVCLVAALSAISGARMSGNMPVPSETSVRSERPDLLRTEETGQTEGKPDPWQAYFNSATTVMDSARVHIPGYFTQTLSPEEIAAIVPEMRDESMGYTGSAGFDGDGDLVSVRLMVTTSVPGESVCVELSRGGVVRDYVLDDEPVVSVCEDVVYTVYQWDSPDGSVTLAADAMINDCTCAFTLNTSAQNLAWAKEEFVRVLVCFAHYADGKPDLSAVAAGEIPEWFDDALTHEGALNDPTYGAYMLREAPDGFAAESIRRYKDQTANFLSGLWTRGYDELHWRVYTISTADETRLTGVADRKNFDLSLYPIPRASSVPEELREIVDHPIFFADELTLDVVWARAYKTGETGDSAGWRMEFSVKYGDILVEVRAKGVDPEWVYGQLMTLVEE